MKKLSLIIGAIAVLGLSACNSGGSSSSNNGSSSSSGSGGGSSNGGGGESSGGTGTLTNLGTSPFILGVYQYDKVSDQFFFGGFQSFCHFSVNTISSPICDIPDAPPNYYHNPNHNDNGSDYTFDDSGNLIEILVGVYDSKLYLGKYNIKSGVWATTYITGDNVLYYYTPIAFHRGKVYYLNHGDLYSVDVTTANENVTKNFLPADVIPNEKIVFDSKDNLYYYGYDGVINKNFYYRNINVSSDSTLHILGQALNRSSAYEMINDNMYVAVNNKVYTIPAMSDSNTPWSTLLTLNSLIPDYAYDIHSLTNDANNSLYIASDDLYSYSLQK